MTEGEDQLFKKEESSIRCLSEKLKPGEKINLKTTISYYKAINGGYHTDALARLHFVRDLMPDGYRFKNWCAPRQAQTQMKFDPNNWLAVNTKGEKVEIDVQAEQLQVPVGVLTVALLQKIPHRTPQPNGSKSTR